MTSAAPPSAASEAPATTAGQAPQAAGVARAAVWLAAGSLLGRALGLAREAAIAYYFGASGQVSVLRLAITLPTLLYDLFFVELVNAALVPVFSARRADLARVGGTVLTLAAVALALVVLALEAFAPQVAWLLGSGYAPELQATAVRLVRLVAPALLGLGLAGVLVALLYTLRRFAAPALVPALYNLLVVVATLALAARLGVASVALGVLAGALGFALLPALALRRAGLRPQLHWRHPALAEIGRLYAPVAAGLVVRSLQVALERNLASHTGPQSLAWLENALTVFRLPLGLTVTVLSTAFLPTLAQQPDPRAFRDTLALGLRWALLLTVPAALWLGAFAGPVVAMLYQRGAFTAADTAMTAAAAQLLLIGLPLAAIDQPLVVAFYARRNTLTPVLVGVASLAVYAAAALWLAPRQGMLGLALASTAQIGSHALMMLAVAHRALRAIAWRALGSALLRVGLVAAPAVALSVWVIYPYVSGWQAGGTAAQAAALAVPAVLSGGVYLAGVRVLGLRWRE